MKQITANSYAIRMMKHSDASDCYALWKKAGLSVAPFDREMHELKTLIEKNPASCFVARCDNQLIGSVIGAYNGRRAWIYHLAVDPHYQCNGIGTQLLKKTEQALHTLGATKILLGVSYTNLKTVVFYEHYGYSVMNDAVHMEKNYWKPNRSMKGGETV